MTGTLLGECLQNLRRRMLAVGISAGLGWALLVWLAVLTGCMWVDLVLELPPMLRLTSARVAVAFGLGWAAMTAWAVFRRSKPVDLARRMDRVARTGGQILSGIDLLMDERPRPGLTRGLADMAVVRAARLAQRVSPTEAVPSRPMGWAFGSLAGVVLLGGFLGLAVPGLVGTQWARFADPFGDHPPFSRIKFQIEPGAATVVYGDPLEIRVRTTGPAVDRVELVLCTNGATAQENVPMFPDADRLWRTTIAHVTEKGEYFIRAHRARSERFKIGLITVPELKGTRFRVTPPAYTHLKPYEGPLPQGGLAGLPGTRVEVWLRSNRPLSGGAMQFETQEATEQLPLQPVESGSSEVTGSFEHGRDRYRGAGFSRQADRSDHSAERSAAFRQAAGAAGDVAGDSRCHIAGRHVRGRRLRHQSAAVVPQPQRVACASAGHRSAAARSHASRRNGGTAAFTVQSRTWR